MIKAVTVGLLGMTMVEVLRAKKEDSKAELLAVCGLGLVSFGFLATKGDEKAKKILKKTGQGIIENL